MVSSMAENFPDKWDFKRKVLAKILLICNNVTMKQEINYETPQKVFHLHNGIFHSINLCHT